MGRSVPRARADIETNVGTDVEGPRLAQLRCSASPGHAIPASSFQIERIQYQLAWWLGRNSLHNQPSQLPSGNANVLSVKNNYK